MTKTKGFQTFYTNTLFYGKYPYKISLSRIVLSDETSSKGWTSANSKLWLAKQKITDYRIYNKSRVLFRGRADLPGRYNRKILDSSDFMLSGSIFLKTKADFDTFVKKYKSNIGSVNIPINEAHISVMESDRSIITRKTLYFKKYRYAVRLKWYYPHDNPKNSIIENWITANFIDIDKECRWDNTYYYEKRIFVNSEDDLTLIKLALSDDIKNISEIRTFDEVKSIQ